MRSFSLFLSFSVTYRQKTSRIQTQRRKHIRHCHTHTLLFSSGEGAGRLKSWLALQHTATHCSTIPARTATHCNSLQHNPSSHCNTLQHTAAHCSTLQHSATHCNALQHNLSALLSYIITYIFAFFTITCVYNSIYFDHRHTHTLLFYSGGRYGVATIRRLLKTIGLFCRILSLL